MRFLDYEGLSFLINELKVKFVQEQVGKDLTENDFTNILKTKLDGIETGANKYTHPSSHAASMIVENATKRFVSDTEKTTWNGKSNFSGNYNDLTSKPTIPTSTNQLVNNSGFITINDVPNEITVGTIKPIDGTTMWYEEII